MGAMLELEEAQARLLALAKPTPVTDTPVEQALGRYLGRDLHAARTQPPADLSAMDGYAVAGLGTWRIMGESRAGSPFNELLCAGQCARISTGAHMPRGADRVLIQEDAELLQPDLVSAREHPSRGQHVRRRGFDFAEGDVVLEAGSRIGPPQLALALSAGHASLPVHLPPKVAIIDSGDELVADPRNCPDDRIPASNGAMISAMLSETGCEVVRIGPVADSMVDLGRALAKADNADIVITSGGASVGDHDLIRPALEAWGAQLDFWKVAMKPGKPILVATRGDQIIVGLPGNPVSSFVTSFLFALPLVRAAMGGNAPLPVAVEMNSAVDLPPVGSRREFLRGRHDGRTVTLVGSQDSSALRALAVSNCLIDRPANAPAAETGTPVRVFPY